MADLFIFLWCIEFIIFWGLSIKQLLQQPKGLIYLFKHLAFCFIACGLFSFIYILANEDCDGFLCQFKYLYKAALFDLIFLSIWPLLLAFIWAPQRAKKLGINSKAPNTDLLDA